MDRAKIERRVIDVIAGQFCSRTAPKARRESRLIEDLSIDSLGVLELTRLLEECFEITIPDYERIETVGDAIDCVERLLARQGRVF